jgi:hypothetical protein
MYLINFIHQHSQFLGTVPDPGVWTVIRLLLSCVGQRRALVPNGLFAVVKQRVHDFLVVQRTANTKEASHNSYTRVKSGVVRMEWSQETIIQFIDGYRKETVIWERLQDTVRRETRDVSHLLRYGLPV